MREITIVIPTHARYQKLKGLLASIERNKSQAIDRVVVVDDSQNPERISELFPGLDIEQISSRKRFFISRAKNIGWKQAKTEYALFIDDDNIVEGPLIDQLVSVISKDDSIGAVMPSVLYKSRPDLVWVYATPFARRGVRLELIGRNLPRNPSLEQRLLPTDALPNACIVRRDALQEVHGFDERLVVNSSMDFCLRLKAKGWKVFAYSGALIYHDVEPPGQAGWWATHGAADPERVRYEVRDWFIIQRLLFPDRRTFRARAALRSMRFVLPNVFGYALRGRERKKAVRNLLKGFVEGLMAENAPAEFR